MRDAKLFLFPHLLSAKEVVSDLFEHFPNDGVASDGVESLAR